MTSFNTLLSTPCFYSTRITNFLDIKSVCKLKQASKKCQIIANKQLLYWGFSPHSITQNLITNSALPYLSKKDKMHFERCLKKEHEPSTESRLVALTLFKKQYETLSPQGKADLSMGLYDEDPLIRLLTSRALEGQAHLLPDTDIKQLFYILNDKSSSPKLLLAATKIFTKCLQQTDAVAQLEYIRTLNRLYPNETWHYSLVMEMIENLQNSIHELDRKAQLAVLDLDPQFKDPILDSKYPYLCIEVRFRLKEEASDRQDIPQGLRGCYSQLGREGHRKIEHLLNPLLSEFYTFPTAELEKAIKTLVIAKGCYDILPTNYHKAIARLITFLKPTHNFFDFIFSPPPSIEEVKKQELLLEVLDSLEGAYLTTSKEIQDVLFTLIDARSTAIQKKTLLFYGKHLKYLDEHTQWKLFHVYMKIASQENLMATPALFHGAYRQLHPSIKERIEQLPFTSHSTLLQLNTTRLLYQCLQELPTPIQIRLLFHEIQNTDSPLPKELRTFYFKLKNENSKARMLHLFATNVYCMSEKAYQLFCPQQIHPS